MSAKAKAPTWREAERGGPWYSHTYWWARLNGWKVEVEQLRTSDGKRLAWWIVSGEHRDGQRVFNSAWEEVDKRWTTREAAQEVAERGAREGWDWLCEGFTAEQRQRLGATIGLGTPPRPA